MQYFNLQSRALGVYGYEWADSNGNVNDTDIERFLVLNVTKYTSGKIDPTYINVGLELEDNAIGTFTALAIILYIL